MATKRKKAGAKKKKPAARRAARPAAKKVAAKAPAGPSMKQQFLDVFRDEHARTMKVLNHFPNEQGAFKPHPRSSSATQLAWTFAIEQGVIEHAIKGTLDFSKGFPPPPATFREAVTAFQQGFINAEGLVVKTPDSRFGQTITIPAGPGKMATIPVAQFCWMMVMDQVHHRGQMSVYSRMAGGKVPSIYGPSADEPWS